MAAVFGPRPGTRSMSKTPDGISARIASYSAHTPGGHQLPQEARNALANALHVLQGVGGDQLAQVNRQSVDPARRGAKRPHAKLVGAADLQHVRERI